MFFISYYLNGGSTQRDRYFLKCYEPNGLTTVLEPEEFAVLEGMMGLGIGEIGGMVGAGYFGGCVNLVCWLI